MEGAADRLDVQLAAGPLRLLPNRVRRFYRGGALLDQFRGFVDAGDGDQPEDWVGSATAAWRRPGDPATTEGLSVLPDLGGRVLRDVVSEAPEALAGPGLADAAGAPTTGLLVKLLDSAIRLPVHAHPSREFARRTLGSFFGKTEAWIVLETRSIAGAEPPHVRLGFRRDVEAGELRGWMESERTEELLDALHHREVRPGDAWLVPGGIPHAIGAGIFLIELQEPVDFSIVAETRDFPIRPDDAHLGLGWDVMIPSFSRTGRSDADLDALRGTAAVEDPSLAHAPARTTEPTPGMSEERLLPRAAEPFFRATRLTVDGPSEWPYLGSLTVGIVTAGEGSLAGSGRSIDLRRGVSFLVPAAAAAECRLVPSSANIEIVCCRPPEPQLLRTT